MLRESDVRTALKIKTSFLLLAWLVIFAHGIIPHIHAEDSCPTMGENCHSSHAIDLQASSAAFVSQPAGEKVCHLSGLMFQNFNPENLFTHSQGEIVFMPVLNRGKIYIHLSDSFISSHGFSSVSFRAPPQA